MTTKICIAITLVTALSMGFQPASPKKPPAGKDWESEARRLKSALRKIEKENEVLVNTIQILKGQLSQAKGETLDGLFVARNLKNSHWRGRIAQRVDDAGGTVFILEDKQKDMTIIVKIDLDKSMKPGDLTVGDWITVKGHIWQYQLSPPGILSDREDLTISISRAVVIAGP